MGIILLIRCLSPFFARVVAEYCRGFGVDKSRLDCGALSRAGLSFLSCRLGCLGRRRERVWRRSNERALTMSNRRRPQNLGNVRADERPQKEDNDVLDKYAIPSALAQRTHRPW